MNLPKICISIFLFLLIDISCSGQTKEDILQYSHIFDTQKHTETYSFALKNINNEVDEIFSGLYLIYKYGISSQDMSSCIFYPSCSTYALQSVQKHGLFIGSLSAFDRLCRCNPFKPKNYPINKETQRYYDPVE
jgi:putative membrane protein insertion efficiency factor